MSGVLLALRQENAFGLGPRSLTESLGSLGAIIVSGSEKKNVKEILNTKLLKKEINCLATASVQC